MLVSQNNENITHAIIGGNQTMDFGISNSPEFFHILSSSLYTDQILAVIREVVCNAWDAHIEAKCTDLPIQVTISDSEFIVRDFGNGISKEDIQPIYGVYGQSTKLHNGEVTGGFGLGCKAPFAYQDHFEVTSWHSGEKTIYAMCKSSGDTNGKPGITPIVSMPTDETGLQVKVAIKHYQSTEFIKKFKKLIKYSGISACLNGETTPLKTTNFVDHKYKFAIIERDVGYCPIFVKYGNVIYPVNNIDNSIPFYNNINTILPSEFAVLLLASPNSICVAPSRESLSMQPKTISTLTKLTQNVIDTFNSTNFLQKTSEKKKKLVKMHVKSCSSYTELISYSYAKKSAYVTEDDLFEFYSVYIKHKMHMKDFYPYAHNFFKQKGTAKSLYSYLIKDQSAHSWYIKEIVPSFYKIVSKHVTKPNKFLFGYERYSRWRNTSFDIYKTCGEAFPFVNEPLHKLVKKVFILAHSEHAVKTRLSHWSEDIVDNVSCIYLIGRTEKNLEALRNDLYSRKDITFIDLTVKHSWEITPTTPKVNDNKPKGIVKSSLIIKGYKPGFAVENYCDNIEEAYITKPKFIMLYRKSDSYISGMLPSNLIKDFLKIYGNEGGICVTNASKESYINKGAVLFETFFTEKVLDYVKHSEPIKRHLTLIYQSSKLVFSANAVSAIRASNKLSKMFGIYTELSDRDRTMLNFWRYLPSSATDVITAELYNRKIHPFFKKIEKVFEEDRLIKYLDMHMVLQTICKENEHNEDSIFLLNLLKNKLI